VNASIRLLVPALLLLAGLTSGCAAGETRPGASSPRLVREAGILADDGLARPAALPGPQARAQEHIRGSVMWSVNAVR
jgi:hypothetical protein